MGRFEVSWNSGHPSGQLTITLMAVDPVSQLSGMEQVTGGSQAVQDPPVLDPSGVVSSATAVSFSPVAPGGLITIYGSLLGDSTLGFSAVPLTTQLGDTQVLMAGQAIPLLYVSPTQINAVVPAGININAPQQVLVQRGSTYSVPVPVDVASAQPSLFASGGQVIAQAYRGSAPPFLVSTQAPATAGDVLVLYTAGLGATNPAIVDGAVSPVANTVSTATVSIGGQNAPVQYAGLTPGFVGLYQVNAVVPDGVVSGSAPVTISIAGQKSPAISLPVH
jgi:adhesin/invasin